MGLGSNISSLFSTRFPKRISISLGVMLLVGYGIYFFTSTKNSIDENSIYVVEKQDISTSITLSGNIEASGTDNVYSPTTGIVEDISVENGQFVSAGTTLFRVISTASEDQKKSAEASYLQARSDRLETEQEKHLAQAKLEEARKAIIDAQIDVDRLEHDRQHNETNDDTNREYTQDEIETIHSTLTSSRQRFNQLEEAYISYDEKINAARLLENAQQEAFAKLSDTTVHAAVSGTVANIALQSGDEVFAEDLTKAEPVLSLSNFETLGVQAKITENDIYRITTGQQAMITLESISTVRSSAVIQKIDTIGTLENGLVTYDVFLALHDFDPRMRPGMTVQVEIITFTAQDAVVIPNNYLQKNNDQYYVTIQSGDKSKKSRPVTIGIKNDTYTQILSGLDSGDIILDPLR